MDSIKSPPATAVPWTLADAARALVLVGAGTLAAILVARLAVQTLDGASAMAALAVAGALEILLFVAVWRFGPWKYGQSWKALGLFTSLNRGPSLALLVLAGSLGFTLLYAAVINAIGLEQLAPPPLPSEILKTYPQRILGFVVTVLLAPLAEEAFFRGFLLPAFAQQWGFLLGAVAASALFSVSHLVPGLLLPAFVSGLLFAWLYRRTGSLWNACLAHGAQNALAFAVAISL